MSNVTQGLKSTSTVNKKTTTKITNLSIPSSGVEVSHNLVSNLKEVIIKSRNRANLQIAFTSTESGTKYITIPRDSVLMLDDLDFSSITLYLQSDKDSTTVEILELS